MLIEFIAFFLGLSLLLYFLFAGADFGAGILESFAGSRRKKDQQELITHAMGPVWEANHVWLILAVVILMNGFPKAFSQISISFHIPLTIMLLGIVMRGCAFTFRHYDAVHDQSQTYYSFIFRFSSILTPIVLGMIAGASILGKVLDFRPDLSFYDIYLSSWLNLFCLSVGLFVCVLFSFLAAVYLIGETEDDELREIFVTRAKVANCIAVVTGLIVFLTAQIEGLPLLANFLKVKGSFFCMAGATFILYPLWKSLIARKVFSSRILAAAQVSLILVGWFWMQFPVLISKKHSAGLDSLTIYNTAASNSTLLYLGYALVGGMLVVLPALVYLLIVFKIGEPTSDQEDSAKANSK